MSGDKDTIPMYVEETVHFWFLSSSREWSPTAVPRQDGQLLKYSQSVSVLLLCDGTSSSS